MKKTNISGQHISRKDQKEISGGQRMLMEGVAVFVNCPNSTPISSHATYACPNGLVLTCPPGTCYVNNTVPGQVTHKCYTPQGELIAGIQC